MRLPPFKRRLLAPAAALLLSAAAATSATASPQTAPTARPAAASQADQLGDFFAQAQSEGDTPVLVRHLPDWEAARKRALYTRSHEELRRALPEQSVLEVVSFAGSEAVTADYGSAGRLVIVEYSTPQIAADSDARVRGRIGELRADGRPAPAVYRRVGNYSVFVFGAADAAAAEQLAARVKYEKDVRWLGTDPHEYDRQNRYWLNMSASVLINTVKATGLAVLLCLGVGGVFGAVIFRRRRAQAALSESYSDAGGTVRLNLDEHSTKLLGQGEK
jgi:hypothetical protein